MGLREPCTDTVTYSDTDVLAIIKIKCHYTRQDLHCIHVLFKSTVSSEFVGKCSDDNSRVNVSLADVQR